MNREENVKSFEELLNQVEREGLPQEKSPGKATADPGATSRRLRR